MAAWVNRGYRDQAFMAGAINIPSIPSHPNLISYHNTSLPLQPKQQQPSSKDKCYHPLRPRQCNCSHNSCVKKGDKCGCAMQTQNQQQTNKSMCQKQHEHITHPFWWFQSTEKIVREWAFLICCVNTHFFFNMSLFLAWGPASEEGGAISWCQMPTLLSSLHETNLVHILSPLWESTLTLVQFPKHQHFTTTHPFFRLCCQMQFATQYSCDRSMSRCSTNHHLLLAKTWSYHHSCKMPISAEMNQWKWNYHYSSSPTTSPSTSKNEEIKQEEHIMNSTSNTIVKARLELVAVLKGVVPCWWIFVNAWMMVHDDGPQWRWFMIDWWWLMAIIHGMEWTHSYHSFCAFIDSKHRTCRSCVDSRVEPKWECLGYLWRWFNHSDLGITIYIFKPISNDSSKHCTMGVQSSSRRGLLIWCQLHVCSYLVID